MTELLTAAQMQAIEQAAIDSGEVTGLELMERAGQGVVEAIFEEWPELEGEAGGPAPQTPGDISDKKKRAVVLCGPGNNGGDGFVVARLLKERGWEVEVFLYGDAEKLPPDARVNYERWGELGEVKPLPEGFWLPRGDVVVDALFGTGLARPIDEAHSYTLTYQNKSNEHLKQVAIDIPSGLCADSGRALQIAGRANLTVTFHRQKHGHYLAEGPQRCGRLKVVDIGLPVPFFRSVDEIFKVLSDPSSPLARAKQARSEVQKTQGETRQTLNLVNNPKPRLMHRWLPKSPANKFTHGHALILSGPSGKGGAGRLAARGALRIGAGLVTVGSPLGAFVENAAQLNAIMLQPVDDAGDLQGVLADERINALCLGPGLGVERAAKLVAAALDGGGVKPRPTVLDADALTALAGDSDLFGRLHERCILTPHAGEFARLFPDIAKQLDAPAVTGLAYSKVDATRAAAKRAGCMVLFKGADTVIAAPDGRCSINSAHYERAAPWLATAGSGDVLAGFITGLLARGFERMQAAETAAYLHVECALAFGPGLIAEDLPEVLPGVLKKLLG